ncbi:hypothetical protein PILCRDRAFT_825611 [Piloderma croceum F 1598]|uniref:Uncharacterized protein n=1 Tax=Piloderma croceum (strain F 1598) TaxID=765440 RepID=A0A0C3BI93_PILCF|nr:hypothetical protein PILCRDRAFT_825611 [Piloderma croceum F 1598]
MSDPPPGKRSKKPPLLRPFKGVFSRSRSRSPSHQVAQSVTPLTRALPYPPRQQIVLHLRPRITAYIIDLTLIMQNLFWLVTIHCAPISRRLIKFASKAYKESVAMADVHQMIKTYVRKLGIINHVHRDVWIRRIVESIDRYRIDTAEMFKPKDETRLFDNSGDEPWDVPMNDTGGTRPQ